MRSERAGDDPTVTDEQIDDVRLRISQGKHGNTGTQPIRKVSRHCRRQETLLSFQQNPLAADLLTVSNS